MKAYRSTNSGDPAAHAKRPLDALNFFLADVRDGLGPYLAIYLLTEQKWDEASIGIVMSIAAGILAQTPAGALVDVIRAKRSLIRRLRLRSPAPLHCLRGFPASGPSQPRKAWRMRQLPYLVLPSQL